MFCTDSSPAETIKLGQVSSITTSNLHCNQPLAPSWSSQLAVAHPESKAAYLTTQPSCSDEVLDLLNGMPQKVAVQLWVFLKGFQTDSMILWICQLFNN